MGAANSPSNGTGARMRAFTHETQPGIDDDYTWTTLAAGTYLYHSGSHVQVQVPMGLYGGMKHDTGAGLAYAGVNYDSETMLLFSEVDPILNAEVANATYGTPGHPTSAIGYRPQYFLINGAVFVPTTPAIQVGLPGQRKLLRFLNAGLRSHVPTLQNGFFHLKAEDGHLLPHGGHEQYSAVLPAGKTVDAMWIPTLNKTYALYDGRLNDSMLVKLAVGVPRAPVAVNDVIAVTRYGTFIAPAPGVLANDRDPDSPTLTAILATGLNLNKGTLVLGSNGTVTYTPPVDFIGNQTFTYRASDGALTSAAATARLAKLLAVKKAEFTNLAGTAQDKWVIEGKASSFAGTSVAIYNGPTLGGTVIATVPIILNAAGTTGNWKYQGTGNIVRPDGSNMISVRSSNGTIFTHVPVTRN
jgi:hypothetical protein